MLEGNPGIKLKLDYDSFARIPFSDRSAVINRWKAAPAEADDHEIVYGHFFPIKYLGAECHRDFKLVTILRDPIDRIISHYKFWNTGVFENHHVWQKMKEENWSLIDFSFSDQMRNFYSQYMEGVGVGKFSYIGIFENLDVSVRRCLDVLGLPGVDISLGHHNKTESNYEIDFSDDVIKDIKKFHAEDYRIYEYAKSRFGH